MNINNAISKNEWDEAYEDLKILERGRRNLQQGSSSEFITRNVGGWGIYPHPSIYNVPSGVPICASVYYDSVPFLMSVQLVFFLEGGGTIESKAGKYLEPSESGYAFRFSTTPDEPIRYVNLQLRTLDRATPSTPITFKEVKVEIGNNRSPWTPAPEDINANQFVAEVAEASYRNKVNSEEIAVLSNAVTSLGGSV